MNATRGWPICRGCREPPDGVREQLRATRPGSAVKSELGLEVYGAIRLLLVRIATDMVFPFAVKTPNAATRKAMAELEKGKGKRFASAEKLFKDFGV